VVANCVERHVRVHERDRDFGALRYDATTLGHPS
jgi:hypothetical protein